LPGGHNGGTLTFYGRYGGGTQGDDGFEVFQNTTSSLGGTLRGSLTPTGSYAQGSSTIVAGQGNYVFVTCYGESGAIMDLDQIVFTEAP
jgi:hypothetical protein